MQTVGPPPENQPPVVVECHCGASIPVARRLIEQTQKCGRCGSTFTVEIGYDNLKHQATVTPVYQVKEAPPKEDEDFSNLPKPAAPTRVIRKMAEPSGMITLDCACGQKLYVTREVIGKRSQCPGCKRVMRIEEVKDPQTLQMTLRPTPIDDTKSTKQVLPPVADFEEME